MPALGPLPPLLVAFIATVLLSFVLGLELHSYRRAAGHDLGFGTTRTLTLLGTLGFVTWMLDTSGRLYAVSLAMVTVLLGVYYWHRARAGELTLLSSFLALLVFSIGPIAQTQPPWFLALYLVVLILMLGEKPGIRRLSDAFPGTEGVTLAKFLILSVVVLPLLPQEPIAPLVSVTYYQMWLAVIVVSGISYVSYLGQTYFFPARGVLLTGLLGGLYSSTATTVVLAREARADGDMAARAAPAMVLATAMMYLRLWLLILVLGHQRAALHLAAPFAVLVLASLAAAWFMARGNRGNGKAGISAVIRHPLELPTALLFAFLFVFFAGLTKYVNTHFGMTGLHTLSFAVGFTDIDPFILALLAGKFHVSGAAIEGAVIIASGSNNLLKAGYGLALARRREVVPAAAWLAGLLLVSLAYAYWRL